MFIKKDALVWGCALAFLMGGTMGHAAAPATPEAMDKAPVEPQRPNPPQRVNVVFILIDDLSDFGLTAYGAQTVTSNQGHFEKVALEMPNMDRLAASGVLLEQAFVYPICEPTRVALMSGMHNGRNYVYPKAVHESQITFSDVLKRSGYTTGIFGKWKQTRGTPDAPAATYLERFGWDEYVCFDVVGEGKRMIDPRIVDNGKETFYRDVNPETGRRWFGPDICNDAALQFLENRKGDDTPFFMYYSMIMVHDEHTPTPDTQPPSAYDDFDTTEKTGFGHFKGDDRRYFPDMLAYTDKLIGKITRKLDELGMTDETVVILMGDNGAKACFEFTMADGQVRQGGKGHHRDKGEHVPMIFSWPKGIDHADGRYEGIFDATDFYPTLLAICGADVPNPEMIDGVNAWPQISGKQPGVHRDAIFKWFNENRAHREPEKAVAYAQTAEFKRYAPHSVYPRGRFFDLRTDPQEEGGERGPQLWWENYYHAGLDLDALTPEQQEAFDRLGEVLDAHAQTAVEQIDIVASREEVQVGDVLPLRYKVVPKHATQNNVVWVSSDPTIASINKFGEVTGHQEGTVQITATSWQGAHVVAAGPSQPAFRTDGIKDEIALNVTP